MGLSTARPPSLIGGVLLVVGNVIGAGILALPIATAQLGLPLALLALILFWGLLLLGAFYSLEANLALPEGANLVSMARQSLGLGGASVAWVCNLLVMYSLIAAYIAGGGDLIHLNLHRLGWATSVSFSRVLFLVVLGGIAMLGIARIDYVNRFLMLFKALVFGIIVFGLMPHVAMGQALLSPVETASSSLLIIVLTSYGFAPIIPTLRRYYRSDVQKIKLMMLIGMVIALLCYLCWVTLILGIIPFQGEYGLHAMATSAHPVADLQFALSQSLSIPWITQVINVFSAICLMTSFLGNAVCLTDFIADGLEGYKRPGKSFLVYFMVYIPPLAAVLFYPRAFLIGMSMAGIIAIILLLILPALMVLRFRARKGGYSWGSRCLLWTVLFIGIALLVWSIVGLWMDFWCV